MHLTVMRNWQMNCAYNENEFECIDVLYSPRPTPIPKLNKASNDAPYIMKLEYLIPLLFVMSGSYAIPILISCS